MMCQPKLCAVRTLLLISFAALARGQNAESIPVGTEATIAQLEQWRDDVAALQVELDQKYSYVSAPHTLATAFENDGVKWSRCYLTDWGGWVYTDWDVRKQLHHGTIQLLQDSISAIRSGDTNPLSPLSYMKQRARVHRVCQTHQLMSQLFEKRLETLAKEGIELDAWKTSEFKDQTARDRAEHWRARSNIAGTLIRRLGATDPLEPNAADRFAGMRDAIEQRAEEHPTAGVFPARSRTSACNRSGTHRSSISGAVVVTAGGSTRPRPDGTTSRTFDCRTRAGSTSRCRGSWAGGSRYANRSSRC